MTKVPLLLLLALALTACGEPDRPSISLYLALQRGDIDQIERHIHWGADINEFDPDGRRPLHVAAATGRVIVVELLLKHGAEVDAPDRANRTALERAVLEGRPRIAELLLRHGASLDPDSLLIDAARAGTQHRDVVRWLVDHGASLETRGTDGDTALLIAIRDNNHRLARHLIDQGADVNVHDAAGNSALGLARALGHEEIAQQLRRFGASDP